MCQTFKFTCHYSKTKVIIWISCFFWRSDPPGPHFLMVVSRRCLLATHFRWPWAGCKLAISPVSQDQLHWFVLPAWPMSLWICETSLVCGEVRLLLLWKFESTHVHWWFCLLGSLCLPRPGWDASCPENLLGKFQETLSETEGVKWPPWNIGNVQ